MRLDEQAAHVRSKSEPIEFIKALRDNLEADRESWENASLERYLGALASWLDDCDGFYSRVGRPPPDAPSWGNVAEMLIAA